MKTTAEQFFDALGVKIQLRELLEEMDSNHWTSNAIEYVEKAIGNYENLLKISHEMLLAIKCKTEPSELAKESWERAIAQAEGRP